jgi:hypothetical protein
VRRKRLILVAGVLLVVVITALGVLQLLPADDPTAPAAADEAEVVLTATEVTNQFLTEFTSGRAGAAAALTDDPAAATAQLTEVWRTLVPASVEAGRAELVEPAAGATAAEQRFTLTWELAAGRSWTYPSTLHLVRTDTRWLVRWEPALVHPRLSAGHSLAQRDRTGQPAVLDRDGAPLLAWAENGPAATDPAIAPVLLPALAGVASGPTDADGWSVVLVDQAGTEVEVVHGGQAAALTATLSRPVQQAAQAAVNSQDLPTMLVAIQPSTGDLLAVAQNAAAGTAPVALNGLYPPGSTFKIATAAAILQAGVAGLDTVLPCPGSATVGQRTVRNADFALGDVPLRRAFAESCNTTFATAAAPLPPNALPDAAAQLGLGADFEIPGIVTEAGAVPAAANTTEQVENSIGQGRVQASCFGVALMAATVAGGRAITPRLWREVETRVNAGYEAPPAATVRALRTMMREVVTSGTGTPLAGYGKVHGKTGTAQVGDGSAAHGWFTGYRDDLAFATLVLDGSSSTAAVAVTGAFLGGV